MLARTRSQVASSSQTDSGFARFPVEASGTTISNFGDPKEKVKIDSIPPLLMPDRFGGESLIIPIEDLCKSDQSLYGTTVIYLYIENKLTRIQLYRPNMEDMKLMDYAMKKYGKFNLPYGENMVDIL